MRLRCCRCWMLLRVVIAVTSCCCLLLLLSASLTPFLFSEVALLLSLRLRSTDQHIKIRVSRNELVRSLPSSTLSERIPRCFPTNFTCSHPPPLSGAHFKASILLEVLLVDRTRRYKHFPAIYFHHNIIGSDMFLSSVATTTHQFVNSYLRPIATIKYNTTDSAQGTGWSTWWMF